MITDKLRSQIAATAREWLGTPFYPHVAKKGIGADCVNFALAVYQEAGAAPLDIVFPPYDLAGGDHRNASQVIDWLAACSFMAKVETPEPGSVVTFKVGRVEHHVGVMTGKTTFAHAIRGYGVIECDLRDSTWKERLRSSWSLIL